MRNNHILLILTLIILSLQVYALYKYNNTYTYNKYEPYNEPRPTVCDFQRNMARQPNQAILVCK